MNGRRLVHRSPPPRSLQTGFGVLVLFCLGCEGESSSGLEPGAVSVRDSAGVVIVEHGPLVVQDSTSWHADLDGQVMIGREEGDPDELFGRVAGFVRLRG